MPPKMLTPEEVAAAMSAAVLRGDVEQALSWISADAVDHSPLPDAPIGHAGWRTKWAAMADSGAGVTTTVDSRISACDTVATRYRITLSHSGEAVGFALEMVRVDDQQIVEHWALPLPQPAG
jgi:predicted SnoaL-like aldol condensation-catalyzing enzyme